MKQLNKVVKSGKGADAEIKAGYKLVRNETKTKRVNLVLTQSNFDKLHKFINKQKKSNPKASINEYFNSHIENIEEETKSINNLQEIRTEEETANKADAKDNKALDILIEHLSRKLRNEEKLTLEEVKMLFLFVIKNDNQTSESIANIFSLFEKLALQRLPAIDKNIETLAYKIKILENKINK